MTMCFERRRNLRWGRETLQSVATDSGAPPELRAEAQAVLAGFPDDRAVALCFLEWDDAALDGLLEKLAAAHRVLRRAMSCPGLSPEVRHAVLATERHFPQEWELSPKAWHRSPRQWIDLYLLRDTGLEELTREWRGLGIEDTQVACAAFAAMGR